MIQNIQFPEGTNVAYQKGGFYDQFDKNTNIKTTTSYSLGPAAGLYAYSKMNSAKKFVNMQMECCFYSSNCIIRIKDTKNLYYTFQSGKYMYDLILDKNIPISLSGTFASANMLSFFTISANATNIDDIMGGSSTNLAKYINWDIDTSELSRIFTPFNEYIRALYGLFSVKKLGNLSYYTLTGYNNSDCLRQITLADIGTNSSQMTVDCSKWLRWGCNTSAIPDARKSLIDSLITYSFDRAAAGYSNCTIKLSAKTKALLTEEEIAQITAKGFTIA